MLGDKSLPPAGSKCSRDSRPNGGKLWETRDFFLIFCARSHAGLRFVKDMRFAGIGVFIFSLLLGPQERSRSHLRAIAGNGQASSHLPVQACGRDLGL